MMFTLSSTITDAEAWSHEATKIANVFLYQFAKINVNKWKQSSIQNLNNFVFSYNVWFVGKIHWQPQLELCRENKSRWQSPKLAGDCWHPAATLNPFILQSDEFLRGACPCLPPSLPHAFEKCGGKLAWEGRDTTPWDPIWNPLPYGVPNHLEVPYNKNCNNSNFSFLHLMFVCTALIKTWPI